MNQREIIKGQYLQGLRGRQNRILLLIGNGWYGSHDRWVVTLVSGGREAAPESVQMLWEWEQIGWFETQWRGHFIVSAMNLHQFIEAARRIQRKGRSSDLTAVAELEPVKINIDMTCKWIIYKWVRWVRGGKIYSLTEFLTRPIWDRPD